MTVKFRPKYTMQTKFNMSLTNRKFSLYWGSAELIVKVRFRMFCQTILWNQFSTEHVKLRGMVWNKLRVKVLWVIQWKYVQPLKMS